eukprot:1910704-Lingulodinium_polyedra.AAC.1
MQVLYQSRAGGCRMLASFEDYNERHGKALASACWMQGDRLCVPVLGCLHRFGRADGRTLSVAISQWSSGHMSLMVSVIMQCVRQRG